MVYSPLTTLAEVMCVAQIMYALCRDERFLHTLHMQQQARQILLFACCSVSMACNWISAQGRVRACVLVAVVRL